MPIVPTDADESEVELSPARALPGAKVALILLLLINLFNYIDRTVLYAVQPKIEASEIFEPGDEFRKTKVGALTTVFLIVYMVAAPVLGWLADRASRWLIVGVGVILWSFASGATGFARAYWFLLITRCLVGIGESAYGPAAPTILAELYPLRKRAKVFAQFYLAMPLGIALGYLVGGYVADSGLGWRWAFYLVVPPGVLLGLWCFWMREPPRRHHRRASLRDYAGLFRIPSFVLNTLGMTALLFALGGIGTWMTTYLYDRAPHYEWTDDVYSALQKSDLDGSDKRALRKLQEISTRRAVLITQAIASQGLALPAAPEPVFPRAAVALGIATFEGSTLDLRNRVYFAKDQFAKKVRQLLGSDASGKLLKAITDAARTPTLAHINLMLGIILVVAGILATLLGSWVADKLRPRLRGAYFLVCGVALLLALPCFFLVLVTPLPWSWLFIFLTTFWLTFPNGPANTILANVTHPSVRATAFALNLFAIHALGDAISPLIIGNIADLYSLEAGFTVVAGSVAVGGVLWMMGARYLERDTEQASGPLVPRSKDSPG